MNIRAGTMPGVLVLSGPFDVDPTGKGATALREALGDLLTRGVHDVTIDLADVPSLDAAAIGEIIFAFNTTRRRGGTLQLFALNRRVEHLLAVTRVGTVIPVNASLPGVISPGHDGTSGLLGRAQSHSAVEAFG